MTDTTPTLLVIVGITGDLSKRKLLPALEQIIAAKAVPADFKVIGITRQHIQKTDLINSTEYPLLFKHLSLFPMDLANASEYERLKAQLQHEASDFSEKAQILYYLSLPPQVSGPIIEMLGTSGLSTGSKLLLEKPFGTDLASAIELSEKTAKHFAEDQIYRIDHYMAKEMAQNLLVFREGNSLLKRTWNNQFIESIEILASEHIGIEGRAAFYEQTGALKDLLQSHLLQLAALTLLQTPSVGNEHEIPALRLAALQQLHIASDKPLATYAKRGQYIGYKQEVQNPDSITETYLDVTLQSNDPRWVGVPIRIITGKALHKKITRICVTYKQEQDHEANKLTINLQPHEGFELQLYTKKPGFDWQVEQSSLKHSFAEKYSSLPDAYEKVLVDAIRSDHTLFTTGREVLESWRIVEPLRSAWEQNGNDIIEYEKGAEAGF